MYPCPYCGQSASEAVVNCPTCDGDLSVVSAAIEQPDAHFNRAVRAARTGDWATALARLGATLAARPTDAEAWLMLGTVYARRKDFALARDCWRMTLMFRPGEARATRSLRRLDELTRPPAPAAEGAADGG